MANETPATGSGSAVPQPSASLSPAERSRLTQCFQHGTQSVAKNIDYSIEMFSQCVIGDMANAIYLQTLFGALRQKHGVKKAGGLSALWSASGRGGLKKLVTAAKFREAITQGVGIIKANPSDYGSLLVMAEASAKLGFAEAQRVYLKAALDAAPDGEHVPYCAKHGEASDPAGRAVVVARSPGRVEVQLSLYAAYREFLDRNRALADVAVEAMREAE
jgi:hypothetical protein